MKGQDNSKSTRTRQSNAERKRAAIKKRFTQLHDVERMRLDDVLEQLCEEYFLSMLTVERILKLRGKKRD